MFYAGIRSDDISHGSTDKDWQPHVLPQELTQAIKTLDLLKNPRKKIY